YFQSCKLLTMKCVRSLAMRPISEIPS
ncbi:hypothetical protein EC890511_2164, partial [Escherichia coli 89.0511]